MSLVHKIIYGINIFFIVVLVVVTIWGFFDIHDRLIVMQVAQVPCLFFMLARRILFNLFPDPGKNEAKALEGER